MPEPETVRQKALRALNEATIVGLVRVREAQRAREVFRGFLEGGLRAIELCATTPGCFDLIGAHSERASRAGTMLGCGGVRTASELRAATQAGARFVSTLDADPDLAALAADLGVVRIVGALTPTEVLAARRLGADIVDLFPVGALGGSRYARTLRGVLPDVPLRVSGDIQLDQIPGYLDAGVALISLCSAIAPPQAADDISRVARERAGTALEALDRARQAAPLLTIHSPTRAVGIGLRQIRKLPGAEHTSLDALLPGRRGAAVRVRGLLSATSIPSGANLRLVSRDGFSRELSARALYEHGFLHWATDGHPLESSEGGPLRLYLVGGDDQCDNVKGLSEIHVLT